MFKLQNFTRSVGVFFIFIICSSLLVMSFLINTFSDNNLIEFATSFEERFYDFRMMNATQFDRENKIGDIVLLDIDDESLEKINSWPIPRGKWADTLDKLNIYGAKVVAFDVMFPEKALACSTESPDKIFADSISNFQATPGNEVILSYTAQETYHSGGYKEMPEDLYNFMLDSQQESESANFTPYLVTKSTYPIPEILSSMPSLGHITMQEDKDGVFRNYQVVVNVDGLYLPSLGLRAYQALTGDSPKIIIRKEGRGNLDIKTGTFPLNPLGQSKIRWKATSNMIDRVSLYDFLSADLKDQKMIDIFKNKIVFIASNATGAQDLRNSPIDSKMPGVMAHVNFVHMLLHNYSYQSLDSSIIYSGLIMIFGLIILLVTMKQNKPILDLGVLIAICTVMTYFDFNYFIPEGHQLKLFYAYASFIFTYSWITFLNFNQTNQEKKQIKGAFSRYVAPSIVNDMLEHPDKLKVGGERMDITCLFSDVRDFTSISEKLTPTQLAKSLNRYMGEMTDIVFATEGTLDKYIGDAIVAFWGAPLAIEDHVNKALDGAVRMLEALPAINDEFRKEGLPEYKIGLGLNSGECSVGNMGSNTIFAYTALGDNMNLGARLESLCKHYGAQILISQYTHAKMNKEKFKARMIDNVKVKGKEEPVAVYEVLYSYHPFMIDENSFNSFNKAFGLYTLKSFEEALALFNDILSYHPDDKSSIRLKERCEFFIANPPFGDEHIVTTMTTK